MERITIRAFRAVDELSTCIRYEQEHARVLEDFGVSSVVKPDRSWMSDPTCHVIIAEHGSLGLVGGIKIIRTKVGMTSPLEAAVAHLDPGVQKTMSVLSAEGNAEVCGLWNSSRFAGRGIPLLLSLAAVSLGNQLGLRTMTCFVAHYTLRHALKAGFVLMEEVGDGGTFSYPIPEIRSMAMVIPDILTLGSARPEFRERLLSLRLRPHQVRLEAPSGITLEVEYDLLIHGKVIDLHAYRTILEERARYSATG